MDLSHSLRQVCGHEAELVARYPSAHREGGPWLIASYRDVAAPLVQIAGWHDVGKTTVGAWLVQKLVADGLVVGVLKHTHHAHADASAGTDTARYLAAGAVAATLVDEPLRSLDDVERVARRLPPCDAVVLEGGKDLQLARWWIGPRSDVAASRR